MMIRKGGKNEESNSKIYSSKRKYISYYVLALHHKCTHAAIGLEEDSDVFYSFAYSGFSKEKQEKKNSQ